MLILERDMFNKDRNASMKELSSMNTTKQAGTQVVSRSDISILFYACHPFPRVVDMESRLLPVLKCELSACLSERKCLSSENNEHYSLCLISGIPLSPQLPSLAFVTSLYNWSFL